MQESSVTSPSKKIVFLTGTRADFGKLKPLMHVLETHEDFCVHLFVTGMHLDETYGYTVHEIEKSGFKNIHCFINHDGETSMDMALSKTIAGFSSYVKKLEPHLIVVHGDRVETLAGASVGALNNILVAHVEGGEISGTVDELIRHAVSKLSHTHFVANEDARRRLLQMGEKEESIFLIGSPDMDIMLGDTLPSLEMAKQRYEIMFDNYAVSLFHPVTTEIEYIKDYAENYFKALEESGVNYVCVFPNNDTGSEEIMHRLQQLKQNQHFKIFPSLRFEYFLTLLKHAIFIIGNSSAGIREAPYYGVPVINAGTRQSGRSYNADIIHSHIKKNELLSAIDAAIHQQKKINGKALFGTGNSAAHFAETLGTIAFWATRKQKEFAAV